MKQSFLVIRVFLMALAVTGGALVAYLFPEVAKLPTAIFFSVLLGSLLILVDLLLKGFSLRALTGLTFGLFVGVLASHFILWSPLFEGGDPKILYISRLCVFLSVTYLATVIALRGKDEFNLVIPYVRFAPEQYEAPVTILDGSSLVDGRVVKLAQARLLTDSLGVPKFVVDELLEQSNSTHEEERNRSAKGLASLDELRRLEQVELRVIDSEVSRDQSPDDKVVFMVSALKGRLLTTSEKLARKARHEGIPLVDILTLAKTLTREAAIGETLSVKLVREGREDGQGVGFLEDGSMAVVKHAVDLVGSTVLIEVESIIPTSGGRMVFGKLLGEDR